METLTQRVLVGVIGLMVVVCSLFVGGSAIVDIVNVSFFHVGQLVFGSVLFVGGFILFLKAVRAIINTRHMAVSLALSYVAFMILGMVKMDVAYMANHLGVSIPLLVLAAAFCTVGLIIGWRASGISEDSD